MSYRQPELLYRNLGSGRFEDVSARRVRRLRGQSRARPRLGDFDNDGDVDILVNNLDGPPTLLRNDGGNRNNWLSIKCVGTRSNRSGIGTRVTVISGTHRQLDEVMSGSSYYSQNDFRLHFGLASAGKADTVEIAWPSGLKRNLSGSARQPTDRHPRGEGDHLARSGSAVVVISQDLDEIFEIADRIAVISRGQLSEAYPASEMTAEKIGLLMAGAHEIGEDRHAARA